MKRERPMGARKEGWGWALRANSPRGESNQWACAPHSGFGAPPLAALVPAGGAQGHALLLVVTEGGGEAPARGGDSAARLAWETAGGYCGVLRHCLRGAGAHSGGAGSGPVRAEPSLRGPFGTCAGCSLNRGSRACISSVPRGLWARSFHFLQNSFVQNYQWCKN